MVITVEEILYCIKDFKFESVGYSMYNLMIKIFIFLVQCGHMDLEKINELFYYIAFNKMVFLQRRFLTEGGYLA